MSSPIRASHPKQLDFLTGGGDMGERIRQYPWSGSALGSPEHWPGGLRTSLRILLTTQHPVFIFWGPELVGFYNDSYSRSLGPEKHPRILGLPGKEAWPEIWDIIGPQIDQVMRGESATWHENALVPIIRHGELQDVYWTYSYGPIDEPSAPNGVGGVLVICTETTEQVMLERRMASERGRFAQLFEQAPVFMTVLRGPQHVFELANPAYMKLINGRPILGRPAAEALPEAVEQGYLQLLDRVYASGEAFAAVGARYEYAGGPNGETITRYLDFVYQPIKEADGKVSGIFVTGVDMTTRALAEAALREADQRKDEFLAMLAHELRNPLAPIRNAAELILRGSPDDPTTGHAAEIVRRQANQLTRIVDDLLDVSRISRGRIELKRETLLLSDVIERAVETVAPLWREKQHQITTQSCLEPVYVQGDLARLVQSFANVMSNAAKYTPPGGRIRIQVLPAAESVTVEISDNGVGIAPEFMPLLFEMFSQSNRTLDRAQGGLGIGLSVVKKIVEMHGGTVAARSAGIGHGSTFGISLPRMTPAVAQPPASQGAKVAPLRILIVDDNADAATSLAALLELDGHHTRSVFTSPEALTMAESFEPRVVLLDIGLPDMDGYEVARRLRRSLRGARMTLIALTGYGQKDDRERAREAGFDAHLVKPVDFAALEKLLAAAGS
ncbi:MAG TPA: ATP-binding protein [Steroidobacteraceae bacterium]|nr:ATP-binding protein [Steroidobacteraceae bacterium]